MGDIFSPYNDNSVPQNATKADLLFKSEKHFMQLVHDFKDEISFIEEKLEAIRHERELFYTQTLPEIKKTMLENEIIPHDRIEEWISVLASEMESSFKMSDELIRHYYTDNLDEFKRKLNELINRM